MDVVGEQGDLPDPFEVRLRGRQPARLEVVLAVEDQHRAAAAAADQPAAIPGQRHRGHPHGLARQHAEQRPIGRRPDPDGRIHAAVTISRPSAGKAIAVTRSA